MVVPKVQGNRRRFTLKPSVMLGVTIARVSDGSTPSAIRHYGSLAILMVSFLIMMRQSDGLKSVVLLW